MAHSDRTKRAFAARHDHLYAADAAYRARHDGYLARLAARDRVVRRYSALLAAAVERGELTPAQMFERIADAQDRTARQLGAA